MDKMTDIKAKIAEFKKRIVKPVSQLVAEIPHSPGWSVLHRDKVGSWLGRVYHYREDEGLPLDDDNEEMYPLAQINVEQLPYVPEVLQGTKYLTLFFIDDFKFGEGIDPIYNSPTENGHGWLIREYTADDKLVVKDFDKNTADQWWFTSPSLRALPVMESYPDRFDSCCDNIDFSDEEWEIYETETSDGFFLGDLQVGGYALSLQDILYFDPGYEFVIQITEFCGGRLYLAKNGRSGEWQIYYNAD